MANLKMTSLRHRGRGREKKKLYISVSLVISFPGKWHFLLASRPLLFHFHNVSFVLLSLAPSAPSAARSALGTPVILTPDGAVCLPEPRLSNDGPSLRPSHLHSLGSHPARLRVDVCVLRGVCPALPRAPPATSVPWPPRRVPEPATSLVISVSEAPPPGPPDRSLVFIGSELVPRLL